MKDLGPSGVRWLITLTSATLIVLHLLFPWMAIDAVTIGLLVVLLLPWTAPLFRSLELPGGVKVEFQDLEKAGDKILSANPTPTPKPDQRTDVAPSEDPQLALVGLRIEIERRLRELAKRHGVRQHGSLVGVLRELGTKEALNRPTVSGLEDLLALGNQAAHGVQVEASSQIWAQRSGPRVLAVLDDLLSKQGAAQQ